MKKLLHLIRFSNLLIIGITLLLLRFVSSSVHSDLSLFLVILVGTILIAAAGNIINDIMDLEIDLINKPQDIVIGKQITKKTAWSLYLCFNLIALCMIVWAGDIVLCCVFMAAIVLLIFYSLKLKKLAIYGNFTVALLCSWVVLEWLWIEYIYLSDYWITIILMYALFAFITTFGRELIKDIEDLEGDKKMGCRTFPVVAGEKFSKIVVISSFSILIVLLIIESYWFYLNNKIAAFAYLCTLLFLPICCINYYLITANQKSDYSILSKWTKNYMILGLGMLLFV
ncbi:geranylgeranylglycerol-phosphate geranylgeranyltransferase [Aureispira]|nr:geranylgeranylglycerol-phosphate geranylgeranyltransferase [Aureispira sp.]